MKKLLIPSLVFVIVCITGYCAYEYYNGLKLEPVKNRLVDPYSAKFHNVHDYSLGIICGEVNSKNKLGAYTGKKAFLIDNGQVYFEQENTEKLIALCIDYPQCQSKGKKAQQCMNEHLQSLKDKEDIKQRNRTNPVKLLIGQVGRDACNAWGGDHKQHLQRQTNQCIALVKKCVEDYKEAPPNSVAECVMQINMIYSTDLLTKLSALIIEDENKAAFGKYPQKTNLTNNAAIQSLHRRGLQLCRDKTLLEQNKSKKEMLLKTCTESVNKCVEQHEHENYQKVNECIIPIVGRQNWRFMLFEIENGR